MKLFDVHYLFASLIWGSVGIGYFVYGKRQQSIVALVGGLLMIAASYLVDTALLMSAICIGLIAAVYFLVRNGY